MFEDDLFAGANASTRRFFSGVSRRSLADSSSFAHAEQASLAAQNAPYGSIAQRSDPNRYGSLESRLFPGQFGPSGALNPAYQREQQEQRDDEVARRSVAPSSTPLIPVNGISPYLYSALFARQQRQTAVNPTDTLDDEEDDHG